MDGSMKRITAYSSDGNPSCFTGDLALAAGVTPTVVIVRGAGTCRDSQHGNLGVVFYGAEPVMWTCLSDGELPQFRAWGQDSFGVPVREVTKAIADVNCPPPMAPSQQLSEATAAMRATLLQLGQDWLAPAAASKPAASKPAAPKPAA
jgi:hypothetical protein